MEDKHVYFNTFAMRSNIFRPSFLQVTIAMVAVVLESSGCSKKADVKSQTSELEKAFPAAASAAPAPSEMPAPGQAPADANAYVKAALSAVNADDYAGSIIALQTAQRARGVTAEQLMAIERSKQAMTGSLVERASRGDEKAKAELSRIEKTRSQ
jgi:hypothetical protein